MGNLNSSNKHHHCHNEAGTSFSSATTKIPKHLQPLKRKRTYPKKIRKGGDDAATNSTTTIANINEKVKEHNTPYTLQPQQQQIGTLQPNPDNEIDQNFLDPSSSSPQLFKWVKGRRFQADDISYPLPNDQTELDRHRVQFYILRWSFNSRHIVPPIIKQKILEGIKVLDIGCGPGLWLGHPILDMAQDFRKSSFSSVDICNLLPQPGGSSEKNDQFHRLSLSRLQDQQQEEQRAEELDNFKFTCHNVVKDGPMPFKADTFDYVQQTLTALVYKEQDWKDVLQEMKRVTKPGGYIQLIEVDIYPQPLGVEAALWVEQLHVALKQERGLLPRVACQLDELLTEIGLTDITTRFVSVPIGSWGLDIGILWQQNVDAFLESARSFMLEILHTTNEQYTKDCHMLKQQINQNQAFQNIHITYGQVPFS